MAITRAKSKKLLRRFKGAAVVRGLGMNAAKLDALVEREALDNFDATRDTFIVLPDNMLNDGSGFSEVRCFADERVAIRYARASSNGNVDHRVLRVTQQTLVIGTDNEL